MPRTTARTAFNHTSAAALTITFVLLFGLPHAAYAITYTWTDRTAAGSRTWGSITSSSDGTKLAAVDFGGDIYTSADSGGTWTDRTAAGTRRWIFITSSSDGTKLAAVVVGGDIYTSADSGGTWTDQTAAGSRSWFSITSSSDGTKLAAVDFGGDIYTSADSGGTWTDQTAAGSRSWFSITSSSDGTKLAAGDGTPGNIWTAAIPKTALLKPPNNLALVGYWSFDEGTGASRRFLRQRQHRHAHDDRLHTADMDKRQKGRGALLRRQHEFCRRRHRIEPEPFNRRGGHDVRVG